MKRLKEYCAACKAKCCKNEKPYASKEELAELGVAEISQKEDGYCIFLKRNRCSVYDKRPFECRIFPFNTEKRNGKIVWVLYSTCPAAKHLDAEKFIDNLEKELSDKFSLEYIKDYVRYDSKDPAGTYSKLKPRILREISWDK